MKSFEEAWKIYEEAFPYDERRDLCGQHELLDNPLYEVKYLRQASALAGFIAYWRLDGFLFIEHFAIDKSKRGCGLGEKALTEFLSSNSQAVVLEVEKPENEIAKKRIAFYERLGFFLNEYDYQQPPFSKDKKAVPLLIMTHPSKVDRNGFENIKSVLYKNVYRV